MQINKLSEVDIEVKLTIAYADIATAIANELNATRKKINLPGFRQGRVPLAIVQRKFGDEIASNIAVETLQVKLGEIIKKEEFDVSNAPQITEQSDRDDKGYDFTVIINVYPVVNLPDFASIEWEHLTSSVTDSDVDMVIEDIRAKDAIKNNNLVESQELSKYNDLIALSLIIIDNDKLTEAFAKHKLEYHLQRNQHNVLQDNFLGVAVNTTATIEVKEELLDLLQIKDEQLKGLFLEASDSGKVESSVTLTKINSPQLPELDDAFMQSLGETNGVESFKEKVKNDMELYLQEQLHKVNYASLFEQIYKLVPLKFSQNTIDEFSKRMVRNMLQNKDPNVLDNIPLETFRESANKYLRENLINTKLVEELAVEVSEDDVTEQLKKLASTYQNPDEFMTNIRQDNNTMQKVKDQILEVKLVEAIVAKANPTEVAKDYFELFKATN